MTSCLKSFFAAIFPLRKLFRRPRQNCERASDETSIVVDGNLLSRTAESLSPPPSPTVNEDPEPRLAGAAQRDRSPLPPSCTRLLPGDIKVLGVHPARAGAFADVWNGTDLAGGPVAIKSYRIYSTIDPTQARMRFYKEALACSQLSHQNIVPFRAVYTTPEHPLALVYDFMEHRGLREYLTDNGGIGRVRLLADIAQGLFHMHDLDIIHGNIRLDNMLVDLDGKARIAGLGSAFISSQNHATWSEMDAELLFYGTAPELARPNPLGSSTQTTKESDIYAFAVLAWEIFIERLPFSNIHQLAAIHLLTGGARPPRPPHPELSDRIWNMIQKCWDDDPSCRILIKDVVAILEREISRNASA